MQADEFEKKIQETMEGFALVPGSQVWEQVSLRIKKEKSRRKVLLYWFFIGFGLLVGTTTWYFLYYQTDTKQVFTRNDSNEGNGRKNHIASKDDKTKKLQQKTSTDVSKIERRRVVKSRIAASASAKIAFIKVDGKTHFVQIPEENKIPLKPNEKQSQNREEQKFVQQILPPHKFYNPTATAKVATGETTLEKDTLVFSAANKEIDRK